MVSLLGRRRAMSEAIGRVAALCRFPVKSMLGEQVPAAELTLSGVVGDRAYALVDSQTAKVVSAKNPKMWPAMLPVGPTSSSRQGRARNRPPCGFPSATPHQ